VKLVIIELNDNSLFGKEKRWKCGFVTEGDPVYFLASDLWLDNRQVKKKLSVHCFFLLLLMQFSARTKIAKNRHAINGAIILFTQQSVLFYSIIDSSVLMV